MGLPREVVKWLQTLDLSFYPKNVRRDFSNGYLVAEIFCNYYHQEISSHSYDKGASFAAKQRNWSQIQQFMQKRNLHLMKEVIDGTIHCKPGAAELLVQEVYAIFTNQSISYVRRQEAPFTDEEYQQLLPSVARSTASKAIKNNLTLTEIIAEPDIRTNQKKAQIILSSHMECKAVEKILNPGHFQIKSQLAAKTPKTSRQDGKNFHRPSPGKNPPNLSTSSTWGGPSILFKEIHVNQPVRHPPG